MSEEETSVKSLTTKEIKALARPEFQANPEKFYPTNVFEEWGFSRAKCPVCGSYYWRHDPETQKTCGDSNCVGKYLFIGKGTGINRDGKLGRKYTYQEAWEDFKKAFSGFEIPHTPIKRYPVVARWRSDVDYVAAGIYNFQPYCVTGELEPPANPLIDAQFCLRFNDLDNIGITGRHYSGFNMLGIQVFNTPDKYVYFKEECVRFNLQWLTETLGIPRSEITLIEDVWAGGGNLGPSVEYFVGGLEVGNMVFMQFKTFPDGSREPLQVQVIDVGIGLERIPWLINGTASSYQDVFPKAIAALEDMIGEKVDEELLLKFTPYSCILDVDESENLSKAWSDVAAAIGMKSKEELLEALSTTKDIFLVCDHTRSLMMAINDGSLPSNVGGASNLRNILRRTFSVCKRHGWWEKMNGVDGILRLFDVHKEELRPITGEFEENLPLRSILEIEYERWNTTDKQAKKKIDKLRKKRKGKLTVDDWILAIQSWGIDPDKISQLTGEPIPENLYYKLSEIQERTAKVPKQELYGTAHLPATVAEYYFRELDFEFEGSRIIEIVDKHPNDEDGKDAGSIIILDKTLFYPTSGGQQHDTGRVEIYDKESGEVVFKSRLLRATKAGKVILHYLADVIPADLDKDSVLVRGFIDKERRLQLRSHHSATHVINAAAKKVLGNHIWQNGAKKSVEMAHIDLTHYRSLTREEEVAIEREANRIVLQGIPVKKYFLRKDLAEKKYGFTLYQGGAIPVTNLRIVEIVGVDIEACGGTHVDNTNEIGPIRIVKTQRVSDGIVRVSFVSYQKAIEFTNRESEIVYELGKRWGCEPSGILPTADRFFTGYKKFSALNRKLIVERTEMELEMALMKKEKKNIVVQSVADVSVYMKAFPAFALSFDAEGKSIVFVGSDFLIGMIHSSCPLDVKGLEEFLASRSRDSKKPPKVIVKPIVALDKSGGKKAKKVKLKSMKQIQVFKFGAESKLVIRHFTDAGFETL